MVFKIIGYYAEIETLLPDSVHFELNEEFDTLEEAESWLMTMALDYPGVLYKNGQWCGPVSDRRCKTWLVVHRLQ